MMAAHPPTFFFSLRSPYSWLAWHDLKTRYPTLLKRLRLVPFWEPDKDNENRLGERGEVFLYSAMSREKHLYILSDIKRLSLQRGLAVHWPIDIDPHWEVPHLAYLAADALGRGPAFIDAVCRLRWQEGRDICDPKTMAALASSLDLPAELLAQAHADSELRAKGLAALHECVESRVFGVPFFMAGFERYWGLDRLPDFIGAVANATRPTPPMVVGASLIGRPATAVFDHAGGCG
jgi:2-hydroxychromene-2-carboxylate isomerase